jgi:hypothetical protein
MKLLVENNATWLWDVAEEDVFMLRGCRSQPMFDKLKGMILSSWRLAGELRLADTFRKSYLDNPLFNKWRYNVSGIPGCIPQNNSHERSNLDTKGCATFAGIIQPGRNMTVMLNKEFSSLIYVNSCERTEVERNFPILDQHKTLKHALFQFYLQFDTKVDCVPYKDGFLVNREYTLGQPIDVQRIKRYEESMEGIFELGDEDRALFYNRVNDLCLVKKQSLDPNKDAFYTGSCFHFYNHLSCHHAAVFQYADKLPTAANKISQEKQGRKSRRKTGVERRNKWQMSKMAEQQAFLRVEKDIKCIYGFVCDPSLTSGHNLAIQLSLSRAYLIATRPTNLACHNLCTTLTPPKNYQSLLGLGLKFCPTLKSTSGPDKLKKTSDRFRKHIHTQMLFAGSSNDWKPKQLFIPKEDWNPDINELPREFRARVNYF